MPGVNKLYSSWELIEMDLLVADIPEFVFPILVIIGFLVAAGIAIWIGMIYEKKRTEKIATVAEELGLLFSAEQNSALLNKLQIFAMFNKGRGRKMKNVMTAETESTSLAIFEYQYTTGSGKNSKTHQFTMAAMETPTLQLPQFTTRPEGFLDRIGSAMGFQDIDFDEHPEFSHAFVLQGENESAIREFFDTRMLDLFARNKGVHVDAHGSMLTYRKKGRQKPESIPDFMAEAYEFLNAFNDPDAKQKIT